MWERELRATSAGREHEHQSRVNYVDAFQKNSLEQPLNLLHRPSSTRAKVYNRYVSLYLLLLTIPLLVHSLASFLKLPDDLLKDFPNALHRSALLHRHNASRPDLCKDLLDAVSDGRMRPWLLVKLDHARAEVGSAGRWGGSAKEEELDVDL